MRLTKKDYETILQYYGNNVVYDVDKKTKRKRYNPKKTRELTRKVVSNKLCQCIKKVQKRTKKKLPEKAAIAICRKSIFRNRGLKHYRFTCKKRPRLYPKKGSNVYLSKTKKLHYTGRK